MTGVTESRAEAPESPTPHREAFSGAEGLKFKLDVLVNAGRECALEVIECSSIEELERYLEHARVFRVRAYVNGRVVFIANMAPRNEEHAKWLLGKLREALEGELSDVEEYEEDDWMTEREEVELEEGEEA